MDRAKAEYIFFSLTYIKDIGKNTALHLSSANNRLYVVKKIPDDNIEVYRALSDIKSPYLANVLYVTKEGANALVMREYVDGDSLSKFSANGMCPLSEEMIVKVMRQLCMGLKPLHERGIIHRDINLNNIILTPAGDIKIIDYGISRFYRKESTRDTVILGTPGFAAPEQFGFSQTDNRSDIYSMGVVLSYLTFGSMPGEAKEANRFTPIIAKCISMEPADRYKNTDEMYRALDITASPKKINGGVISAFPGLRSKEPAIVVLAALGYIFSFYIAAEAYKAVAVNGTASLLLLLVSSAFSVFIPACLLHGLFGLREKYLPLKGKSPAKKIIIYALYGISSIIFGFFLFGLALIGI